MSGAVRAADPAPRNENRLAGEAALDLVENPYSIVTGIASPSRGCCCRSPAATTSASRPGPAIAPGPYRLRTWVDDTTPPTVRIRSHVLYGTAPELRLIVRDRQSGFDPASLSVTVDGNERGQHVSSSGSNVSVSLGHLAPGQHHVRISAADYQELKNSENADQRPLPNTRVVRAIITVR